MFSFFKKKKVEPIYDTRQEMVYTYELNLLRIAAFEKGRREEAIKKLKTFMNWRLSNGK